jgi:hypothetical protein
MYVYIYIYIYIYMYIFISYLQARHQERMNIIKECSSLYIEIYEILKEKIKNQKQKIFLNYTLLKKQISDNFLIENNIMKFKISEYSYVIELIDRYLYQSIGMYIYVCIYIIYIYYIYIYNIYIYIYMFIYLCMYIYIYIYIYKYR